MEKKTVLITGATSGIGAGCARRFAKEGWRVIITGRNKERLNALTAELKANGTPVLPLLFDVRDRKAATEAVKGLP